MSADAAAYRAAEATLWDSVGLSATEHEVRLACTGTPVRVQEVGRGDPVLFLHGGPSAGSTWAWLVALRFARMVQMACPALSPGEQAPPFMRLLTKGWVRRIMNALPPNERANRSIMRQIGHGKSLQAGRLEAFLDYYLALQRHTDTMRNDGELIGQLVPHRPVVTLTDDLLAAVAVPTLFLWGADDAFGGQDVARHVVGACRTRSCG